MVATNYQQNRSQSLNDSEEPRKLNQDFVSYVNRKDGGLRKKRIIVYQGKRIVPVDVSDIYVVFTDNNYRFIQTGDEQYSCTYTLENMEQMFGSLFFRVNRQYLISYESIDQILIEDATKLCVRLRKPYDIVMQISRRRIHQFIQWIENGSL
jgi:two-component system, LytTR family, response regulator LytT